MVIKQLYNTCSMFELHGSAGSITQGKSTNKLDFIKSLYVDNEYEEGNFGSVAEDFQKIKCIIYNIYENSLAFQEKMKVLGFKKVFTYTGNDHPKIYTWLMKITKKEMDALAKHFGYKYDKEYNEYTSINN